MLSSPTVQYGRTGTLIQQNPVRPITTADQQGNFWGADGFQFGDILDILNPLQHIPLVSDLYQQATGDMPSPGSKVAGGALFGGIAGLLAGFVSSTIEQLTGQSVTQNMVAMMGGAPEGTQLAANNNMPAPRADWSQAATGGERFDTVSYIRKYQTAQTLTQMGQPRFNVAA